MQSVDCDSCLAHCHSFRLETVCLPTVCLPTAFDNFVEPCSRIILGQKNQGQKNADVVHSGITVTKIKAASRRAKGNRPNGRDKERRQFCDPSRLTMASAKALPICDMILADPL